MICCCCLCHFCHSNKCAVYTCASFVRCALPRKYYLVIHSMWGWVGIFKLAWQSLRRGSLVYHDFWNLIRMIFYFCSLPGVYGTQRQIVCSHFFHLEGLFNQIKSFFISSQKKMPRLGMNYSLSCELWTW